MAARAGGGFILAERPREFRRPGFVRARSRERTRGRFFPGARHLLIRGKGPGQWSFEGLISRGKYRDSAAGFRDARNGQIL